MDVVSDTVLVDVPEVVVLDSDARLVKVDLDDALVSMMGGSSVDLDVEEGAILNLELVLGLEDKVG